MRNSQVESRLDLRGTFRWRPYAGVYSQIVRYASVHTVELPARQSDPAIASFRFSPLKDVQGRENTDTQIETGQQVPIVPHAIREHDIVDDQIVARGSHRCNGMPHAMKNPLADRPDSDAHGGFAAVVPNIIGNSIGMLLQRFRHHLQKRVHLHMQERFARQRL